MQDYPSDSLWFDERLKTEIQDRKLLIFHFWEGKLEKSNFAEEIDIAKFLEIPRANTTLKTAWTLVGLDGGVKNSGKDYPLPKEIFKLIDSMPMRQSEMRNSKK